MKKIWELKYSQKFILNGTRYYVLGPIQRISQTSIVRICVNESNGNVCELNANDEVETVLDGGSTY